MTAPARRRLSAEERRAELLAVALEEFARTGYHGTSTEVIAERAGISQPYVFRLYGTKKDLFLACVDLCFDRTLEIFRDAVANPPEGCDTPRQAMGNAYVEMLGDRALVLFQHQTYAAADDPDVRAKARERFEELGRVIEELAGLDATGRSMFVGQGMLLNVIAALGFEAEEWVFLGPGS
ncbi:MAG: TetR/AcrR family transcriptional regulator [Actinomycetota bacterium]|nr:TetR/AcrR family transcriptional regulator [Actinomycetota bacterium]